MPKDDLKRLGKDLSKKLVASDYKNNRVTDPTAKLNEKQARKIKTYVKDFLDRAVQKYEAQKKDNGASGVAASTTGDAIAEAPSASTASNQDDVELSDVDMDDSPASRKRKHDDAMEGDDDTDLPDATPNTDGPDVKRLKEMDVGSVAGTVTPSPPPPPPPPFGGGGDAEQQQQLNEEQKALREQEEALERENEEAQRLEDEAQRTNGEQQQGQSRKQEVLSH